MTHLAVAMPAWNEAAGIAEFLHELSTSLAQFPTTFVVVDDASTDGMRETLESLSFREEHTLQVFTNDRNQGHGPSTLRALREATSTDAEVIVALDGDGQFYGADIARVVGVLLQEGCDVVEGVRQGRTDPWFRKPISLATRALVFIRSGRVPLDANTPLRAYFAKDLERIISTLPAHTATPNLLISSMTRKSNWMVFEVGVTSIPRRGGDASGSTWGGMSLRLPNKRLLRFCAVAFGQWLKTNTPIIARHADD
jgi:dolichol-phosphate mannosyltransferase